MKAHIVLAHPEPKSFNGHLSRVSHKTLLAAGWDTSLSDLYAMDFDPREGPQHYTARKNADIFDSLTEQRFNSDNNSLPEEVQSEINHLLGCDLLVVHFPFWWFGMPAMLKGWMDRVFAYGATHRSIMRYDSGSCVGKRVIACVTTGADADGCSFKGKEGDIQLHLWPILFPFRYLGFDVLQPEAFHGVAGKDFANQTDGGLSTMELYSDKWAAILTTIKNRSSLAYNPDSDFDDSETLLENAPVYSPFVRQKKDFSY